MESFLVNNSWTLVKEMSIEGKDKKLYVFDDLCLSNHALTYLSKMYPAGIYCHQKEAIKAFLDRENVCLATGTASGKSLTFYVPGIETIGRSRNNKIIAVYPLKSLGREQESRWQEAIHKAGFTDAKVGRIDGQVDPGQRKVILKNCNVVIITPDVIHAWLLPNIGDGVIASFVKSISLVIVDEVHTYTGVFGSNSAFLFRRLRHLLSICNTIPQFICASATIANPESHLNNLFGVNFRLIGAEYDTSPKHNIKVVMLNPPRMADFLTEVSRALREISEHTERFIAFVDSRKQTELISSILSRNQNTDEEDDTPNYGSNHLSSLNILPYRAGYEEQDRDVIQRRLSEGMLKGVISTSALELGLDIKGLDCAVLIGVPYSSTSLFQRIGRIGRHCDGTVYIINTGSFYDEVIFKHPEQLLKRPLAESALYLENPRIQYIHALCLARQGGEHDQLCSYLNKDTDSDFDSNIEWPKAFISLCKSERIGEIPADLQSIKLEAGDDPNHTFPLRDAESQFKVSLKHGPENRDMGSLSYSQLLREAYPGAVYYYTTNAYRVYKVNLQAKEVFVRPERRYTTSPIMIPALVFPNLTSGNVYNARKHGGLIVFESNLQVRESIGGFDERRGPNKKSYKYPLDASAANIYYDRPRFTRNYFTSGVVFTHPLFSSEEVTDKDLKDIGSLIYESFLISIPFERQDINWAIDKHRMTRTHVAEGEKFIAIFDRTYGSLRLSGHVMAENLMEKVFSQAIEIADINDEFELTNEAKHLLEELYNESLIKSSQISFDTAVIIPSSESYERIIMPGSVGLALNKSNEEFIIENVFFHPKYSGLCYRGRYISQKDDDSTSIIWPVTALAEIPGESKIGFYNYDTGEVCENISAESVC